MNYTSEYIEKAVLEISKLPGIGKKTALRLVLHIIQGNLQEAKELALSITDLKEHLSFCAVCANVSDQEICNICSNSARNHQLVCVVESIREVMAIENTHQYNGCYHVLGGVISPIHGVGPEKLTIDLLLKQVNKKQVSEIIMALNPTMDGDTTIFYISKKLQEINPNIKITTIARGVAFGGELEYVDEVTLARSIATRLPFDNYLSSN